MQEKYLFEYAVIRMVPRVEREEFCNVGIILFSKEQKFLQAMHTVNEAKVKALDEKADIPGIRAYLEAIEKNLPGRQRWRAHCPAGYAFAVSLVNCPTQHHFTNLARASRLLPEPAGGIGTPASATGFITHSKRTILLRKFRLIKVQFQIITSIRHGIEFAQQD